MIRKKCLKQQECQLVGSAQQANANSTKPLVNSFVLIASRTPAATFWLSHNLIQPKKTQWMMNILSSTVVIKSFTVGIDFISLLKSLSCTNHSTVFLKFAFTKSSKGFYATKEIVTEHFVKWFARLPLWLLLEYW